MAKREPNSRSGDRGTVAVLVAASLLVLLGFAALAIDIGYVMVARNELQTGADAAALAGARKLIPYVGTGTPNWADAYAEASNRIALNKVTGRALTQGTVSYGYWDLSSTTQKDVQASSSGMTNPFPAVQVTVARNRTSNGGPIRMFFAGLIGVPTVDSRATAVAVISSPSRAGPGVLFPVVITKCMYDNYWDPATQQPTLNTPFKMTSSYHTGPCEAGQWSGLSTEVNDTNSLRDLIGGGNSVPIGVGDEVWISPGTKTALYDNPSQPSVRGCSAAGDKSCEYVTVAVVNEISTHAWQPVLALACMRILDAVGGSEKYILAEMVPAGNSRCQFSGTDGVGPSYGVTQPPRLTR